MSLPGKSLSMQSSDALSNAKTDLFRANGKYITEVIIHKIFAYVEKVTGRHEMCRSHRTSWLIMMSTRDAFQVSTVSNILIASVATLVDREGMALH